VIDLSCFFYNTKFAKNTIVPYIRKYISYAYLVSVLSTIVVYNIYELGYEAVFSYIRDNFFA